MAPVKRKRQLTEDEDPDAVDVESAQSSSQEDSVSFVPDLYLRLDRLIASQRKKARASYDALPSDGSQNLTDEEMFEEQATQFLTQQRGKKHMDNEPADNGIIESITCQNFMCHSHLEIALGPLINFIIGHNGSGKSAILTAITLCLGGKATATNRGQSLKSFIKEGQEYVRT